MPSEVKKNIKKDIQVDSDSDNETREKEVKTMKEIKQTFASKSPKDFHKIRILGKGGVGRVYLVKFKDEDKLFAMKVLKQDEMISRNKVQLFFISFVV